MNLKKTKKKPNCLGSFRELQCSTRDMTIKSSKWLTDCYFSCKKGINYLGEKWIYIYTGSAYIILHPDSYESINVILLYILFRRWAMWPMALLSSNFDLVGPLYFYVSFELRPILSVRWDTNGPRCAVWHPRFDVHVGDGIGRGFLNASIFHRICCYKSVKKLIYF